MLSLVADLEDHTWYVELVSALIADVESYLARWAAFEEYVGEPVV
jgi:hypothetical protein